jgi:hypothetical protein
VAARAHILRHERARPSPSCIAGYHELRSTTFTYARMPLVCARGQRRSSPTGTTAERAGEHHRCRGPWQCERNKPRSGPSRRRAGPRGPRPPGATVAIAKPAEAVASTTAARAMPAPGHGYQPVWSSPAAIWVPSATAREASRDVSSSSSSSPATRPHLTTTIISVACDASDAGDGGGFDDQT